MYSSVDRHLESDHVLAIMNKAEMSMGEHVSVQYEIQSLGDILRSGICRSYGKYIAGFF